MVRRKNLLTPGVRSKDIVSVMLAFVPKSIASLTVLALFCIGVSAASADDEQRERAGAAASSDAPPSGWDWR